MLDERAPRDLGELFILKKNRREAMPKETRGRLRSLPPSSERCDQPSSRQHQRCRLRNHTDVGNDIFRTVQGQREGRRNAHRIDDLSVVILRGLGTCW